MTTPPLSAGDRALLAGYDTPTICNVIELFEVRPRHTGYMDGRIRACFPEMPAIVGYASTATIRAAFPKAEGTVYTSLDDQVEAFAKLPGPPIVVFQDLDEPTVAATFGEIMCATYQAFGAAGLITSGAARDLDQVRRLGFPAFSNGVNPSHGYSHMVSIHEPVHVGGLAVHPGDLLHADCERDWESKFRAIPNPQNLRDYMQRLSARPHHVGSAYDKDNAEWILAKFKEWGLDAKIETFDVLFPTPKERAVELVEPTRFTARLQEPAVAEDPTSNQQSEQLPTYNAYSIDGDVTAPLVYVNYGIPEDYEQLERLGISVKGAIVIARYGGSWRGIKPKVAAEHGAVGCIIYSDPRDDGYYQGDVFPKGPYRPKTACSAAA